MIMGLNLIIYLGLFRVIDENQLGLNGGFESNWIQRNELDKMKCNDKFKWVKSNNFCIGLTLGLKVKESWCDHFGPKFGHIESSKLNGFGQV